MCQIMSDTIHTWSHVFGHYLTCPDKYKFCPDMFVVEMYTILTCKKMPWQFSSTTLSRVTLAVY